MQGTTRRNGVKFSTEGPLRTLEDWLDENCADSWKLVLLDLDAEFERKEVQIMFASKTDKDKFIAAYAK